MTRGISLFLKTILAPPHHLTQHEPAARGDQLPTTRIAMRAHMASYRCDLSRKKEDNHEEGSKNALCQLDPAKPGIEQPDDTPGDFPFFLMNQPPL